MSDGDEFNAREQSAVREQAAEWFVRLREGQVSEEERDAFDLWISADPQHSKEYKAVQEMWRELDGLKSVFPVTDSGDGARPQRKSAWKPLSAATALAAFLFAGLLVFLYEPGSYETAKGEQRMLYLADNSVVRLNSDTLLQVELTPEQRTLRLLRGEAFFEVAHDPGRPFVVISAGGAVRAVGTKFNIYRLPSDVRVTVVEGRVEVATQKGKTRLLNAEEVVAYETDGGALSQIGRRNGHALDWLEGRIYFEATPLTDVVRQLNRYLETPLLITDPELNELELSGTFRISNLESLPELLPRLLPVSLEHAGDRVLLHHSY
jgi:transmembrane sensor